MGIYDFRRVKALAVSTLPVVSLSAYRVERTSSSPAGDARRRAHQMCGAISAQVETPLTCPRISAQSVDHRNRIARPLTMMGFCCDLLIWLNMIWLSTINAGVIENDQV